MMKVAEADALHARSGPLVTQHEASLASAFLRSCDEVFGTFPSSLLPGTRSQIPLELLRNGRMIFAACSACSLGTFGDSFGRCHGTRVFSLLSRKAAYVTRQRKAT